MKKVTITKYGLSILALTMVTGAGVANAQERLRQEMPTGPRPALEERQENLEEKRATVLERVGEAREAFQEDLEGIKLEKAEHREEREENREEMKERNEARVEAMKGRVEERRQAFEEKRQAMLSNKEARRAKLSEVRKEKVSGLFDQMFDGFASAAGKLDGISERLAAKISELESEGLNVDEALSTLETANDLLEDTLAEIEAVQSELDKAVEGEITKEYVRELVSSAKESIRATHEAYRAVISEINSL